MRRAGLLVVLAAAASVAVGDAAALGPPPADLVPGQHPYASLAGGTTVRYLLYAPAAVARDPDVPLPLIVYLHGTAEIGDDPRTIVAHELPKTLASTTSFPALVLSPQLPPSAGTWSGWIGPVDALVQKIETTYAVDPKRVYLTGISLGGFGTWWYGLRRPGRFAALVPMGGGYVQGSTAVPAGICTLRRMPIWAFAGALDRIVYPYQSQAAVKALRACGSKVVRLTVFAGVDHFGTWPLGYGYAPLWRWLFAQRRG